MLYQRDTRGFIFGFVDKNKLNVAIFAFINITYNMEPYNFSYIFTKPSKTWQEIASFLFIIHLTTFIVKREVATSIKMTFCDKKLDMHDISVID